MIERLNYEMLHALQRAKELKCDTSMLANQNPTVVLRTYSLKRESRLCHSRFDPSHSRFTF